MAHEHMTQDEIIDALTAFVGETGRAELRGTGLYVRREENSGWGYIGTVADAEAAQQTIDDYFNA